MRFHADMRHRLIVALLGVLVVSSCGLKRRLAGDTFKAGVSPRFGATHGGERIVETVDENGTVIGRVTTSGSATQTLLASASGALSGASVSFPPGSVAVDMDITLTEGRSLADDGALTELQIGADVGATALTAALLVQTSASVNPIVPFQVALSVPGLSLTADTKQLFVVFRVHDYKSGKLLVGVLGQDELRVDGAKVTFSASYFGSYQIFSAPVAVAGKVQETAKPIVSKADADGKEGGDGADSGASDESDIVFALASSSFADGAVDLPRRTSFTLTMSRSLNTSVAVQPGVVTIVDAASGIAVDHTVAVQADNKTIEVTLTQDLALKRTYSVMIDATLQDSSGAVLGTPIFRYFTTRAGSMGSYVPLTTAGAAAASGYDPVIAANSAGVVAVVVRTPTNELVARLYDGTWTNAVTIATSAEQVNPKIAVAEDGSAMVAWIDAGALFTSMTSDGGASWTSPVNHFQTAAVRDFGLKATNGRYYLSWFERPVSLTTTGSSGDYANLFYAHYESATWSSTTNIWGNGSAIKVDFDKGMAVNQLNHLVVTWWQEGGFVYAFHSANTAPGYNLIHSTGYPNLGNAPQIALHSSGNAVAVWESQPGNGQPVIYNKYTIGALSWGATEAQLIVSGRFPNLATATSDEAVASWVDAGAGTVSAARFNFVDQAWRATETLASGLTGLDGGLKVLPGNGGASVVWLHYDAGVTSYRPMTASYRSINATYGWSVAANVTPGGSNYYDASGLGYGGIDDGGNVSYFGPGSGVASPATYSFAFGNGGFSQPFASFDMVGYTAVKPRGLLVLPNGVTFFLLRAEESDGDFEMGIRTLD